jgi:hypothetical protein
MQCGVLWCVISQRRCGLQADGLLDTADVHATRRAFDWRITTMRSLRSPASPRNGLLAIFFPCRLRRHSSRNNKIARPAILRSAAGLEAAGRASRR